MGPKGLGRRGLLRKNFNLKINEFNLRLKLIKRKGRKYEEGSNSLL
jgi:hypothetical protein